MLITESPIKEALKENKENVYVNIIKKKRYKPEQKIFSFQNICQQFSDGKSDKRQKWEDNNSTSFFDV